MGITWSDAVRLPPKPRFIGADIERYRTLAATAGAKRGVMRVAVGRGNVLLAVSATAAKVKGLELISPSGRRHSLSNPGPVANAERAPDGREAILIVAAPERGTWRVKVAGRGSARTVVQQVPPLTRLRVRSIQPRTTKSRRLGRRSLRVRWKRSGLPGNGRVQLLTSSRKRSPGRLIASAPLKRGVIRARPGKLHRGANHLTLIVSSREIPYQSAGIRRTVWR